jgi:pimeloyl-ACP methyl ester carboxylesterase
LIAAILTIALLAELALYLAAGAWLWRSFAVPPAWSALAALAAFLLLRAAVVGLQFRLAWRWRARGTPRLTWPLRAAMLAREIMAVLLIYTLGQILQRRLVPHSPGTPARGIPVLLVHGIYCNAGVWHVARRYLKRGGIGNLFAVNLEPPLAGIDELAARLAERVEEVCRASGAEKVVLLAHSMGGLVSRAYVAKLGGAQRVAGLVTLGSPHHGSELARLAIGRCGSDMIPKGPWLAALEAAEGGSIAVPAVSIFSWHDNMVAPQDGARLAGARNVALERLGHLELLLDPEALRLAGEAIAAAEDGARSGRQPMLGPTG